MIAIQTTMEITADILEEKGSSPKTVFPDFELKIN